MVSIRRGCVSGLALLLALSSTTVHATKSNFVVDLELVTEDAALAGGQGPVTFLILPNVPVEQARAEFEVEYGDAVITGTSRFDLGTLEAGGAYTAESAVRLTASGKVSVRATLIGVEGDTRQLFKLSKSLLIFSSGEFVASGNAGYIPLQVEVLKSRQKAGRLTKSRYDDELNQALYGGAHSEIEVTKGANKGVAMISVSGQVL